MYSNETSINVRYYETDQMGIVHHSNYVRYFEIGRTELMRSLGASYREMEDEGTEMPIIDVHVRYVLPARYDDKLIIRTTLKELPQARITFYYQIFNQNGQQITEGSTVLAFVNKHTMRPTRAPRILMDKLEPIFASANKYDTDV